MVQVGEWTSAGGLSIMDKYAFTEGRPPNITLKVLSRIEEPFVMFRKVRSSLLVSPNYDSNYPCRLRQMSLSPRATTGLRGSVWICWSKLQTRYGFHILDY